jgi:alpha-amylase/alpha-mannosidase (GH57 family)
VQLQGYTDGGATDKLLRVSRVPAEDLPREDALYLLDNAFMAHLDRMIRPHPRYFELWRQRGFGVDTAEQALKRFRARDLRDLQVWANMAWIHPIAFEKDARLEELRIKRRGYSEEDKRWMLDQQIALLREVIPLHRRLMERGQIELTTTPFYHPILPLLWDKTLAREALPDLPMPRFRESYPEDAAWHIVEAVRFHEQTFGAPPRGMWPSEGSVCQAIIPKLAESGIRWIATDEEILYRSLDGRVSRDPRTGFVRQPELLYRAWNALHGDFGVSMVFRDHALSDQIGFEYQRFEAHHAAADFMAKLGAIGKATEHARPTLVSVILDGENCWEYYPHSGIPFLRQLYQQLSRSAHVRTARISDYLAEHPPRDSLHRLFSGSWINHNFYIWIGHADDRRAWDLLHQTREYLKRMSAKGQVRPEALELAWRELHIAEGSDWFWWFGDDHSSAQDALFDYLFRKHLMNVYAVLGDSPPPELSEPIGRVYQRKPYTEPVNLLSVTIDGRFSYFEWINAGRYTCGSERGTMTRVTEGLMREILFGFSPTALLLRIDGVKSARSELAKIDTLRVHLLKPEITLAVTDLHGAARVEVQRPERSEPMPGAECAMDRIIELQAPFDGLGIQPGDSIRFYVELLSGETAVERVPQEGTIELRVPPADFDPTIW